MNIRGGERNAVIINSRQGKYPCGSDEWVKNTIVAVNNAIERNFTILSSVGMNTHELVLWAANKFGGKQTIIYPLVPREEKSAAIESTIADFNLDIDRATFRFIPPAGRSGKGNWRKRDELMISAAHCAYTISIRPKSGLMAILQNNPATETINTFAAEYSKKKIPKYRLDYEAMEKLYPSAQWHYLTHWTHCHAGHWIHENKANYYEALISSRDEPPRSARRTLNEIKRTGVIFASATMIRGNMPAISFTSHPPQKALQLMRWRNGLGRYNFEPYGVAVEKNIAKSMGAEPAIYGDEKIYRSLDENQKRFFQFVGKDARWHSEAEWRHIGDFQIKSLPTHSYFFIYPENQSNESNTRKIPIKK